MVQQMVQQILLFSRSSPGSLVIHRSLLVKSTSDLGSTIENDSDGGKPMEKITKITIVDAEKQAQWGKPTGRNYVRSTQTDRCHIALNCYEPGVNDELHCHPGSDHTFFVVQGECTMKGLKEGEEYHLKQHQAMHVPPGFFYQLNNTGTERLILY